MPLLFNRPGLFIGEGLEANHKKIRSAKDNFYRKTSRSQCLEQACPLRGPRAKCGPQNQPKKFQNILPSRTDPRFYQGSEDLRSFFKIIII